MENKTWALIVALMGAVIISLLASLFGFIVDKTASEAVIMGAAAFFPAFGALVLIFKEFTRFLDKSQPG